MSPIMDRVNGRGKPAVVGSQTGCEPAAKFFLVAARDSYSADV